MSIVQQIRGVVEDLVKAEKILENELTAGYKPEDMRRAEAGVHTARAAYEALLSKLESK